MDQKRILVIEDDQFIQDLYKEELTNAGFLVDTASNGQTGLTSLSQNHYDLLLLDIMLPDTNGLEILKKVKADSNTKDLKVVLLSNLGQEQVIKQGQELGAAGYLIKVSLNPDEVIEEVRKFLQG